MSNQIRAKFYVTGVDKSIPGYERVNLSPVIGSRDASDENNSFSEATPSGSAQLSISNPGAHGFFIEGEEYYLDFSPAKPEALTDAVYPSV